jgi:hypothetical protein
MADQDWYYADGEGRTHGPIGLPRLVIICLASPRIRVRFRVMVMVMVMVRVMVRVRGRGRGRVMVIVRVRVTGCFVLSYLVLPKTTQDVLCCLISSCQRQHRMFCAVLSRLALSWLGLGLVFFLSSFVESPTNFVYAA